MRSPVSVSSVTEHEAMSPAPTNTGSALGVVWKVQVGPVVVSVPSLTVTYHSNFWPAPRLAQVRGRLEPEATPVFCAIWREDATREGRPKKVTVSGSLSGSDTPTSSVGEVPTPVAALAGALRVGAEGALLANRRDRVRVGRLVAGADRVDGRHPEGVGGAVGKPADGRRQHVADGGRALRGGADVWRHHVVRDGAAAVGGWCRPGHRRRGVAGVAVPMVGVPGTVAGARHGRCPCPSR